MTSEEIARRVECCSCRGKIGQRVNLVELNRRALWEYPRNHVLLDTSRGPAIQCLVCGFLSSDPLGVHAEVCPACACRWVPTVTPKQERPDE